MVCTTIYDFGGGDDHCVSHLVLDAELRILMKKKKQSKNTEKLEEEITGT